MSKKQVVHAEPVTTTETLQEESDRLIREEQERLFQQWKEENPVDSTTDSAQDPAVLAVQVAEQAVRNFGSSALAGLRSGGAFVAALKGANAEQVGRAASRLDLAREKCVAKRGALLRADVPESSLAAAKAAEAFLFDLGVEIAKRSDLF